MCATSIAPWTTDLLRSTTTSGTRSAARTRPSTSRPTSGSSPRPRRSSSSTPKCGWCARPVASSSSPARRCTRPSPTPRAPRGSAWTSAPSTSTMSWPGRAPRTSTRGLQGRRCATSSGPAISRPVCRTTSSLASTMRHRATERWCSDRRRMFEAPSEETRSYDEIAESALHLGQQAAAETTGARVLRGGLWNALGRVLPQLYVVVQSVVAARFLGINGMGQQSYISFVALTIGSVFGFGLSGALVRSVGEAIGRGWAGALQGLLGWAWRIVIVGAVLGGVVTMLFAIPQPELRTAWLFAAIGCSASVLITVPTAVLGGLQRWREVSIITLVLGGVGAAATVAVLMAG